MNKKLSELNSKLKYKILKFDVPACKIKYLQVGPDWLKFTFKKNDAITFGIKFSKFLFAALEAPRMPAVLSEHSKTGIIRLDYTDKENEEYVKNIYTQLITNAEFVKHIAADRMKYTINDSYGFSVLLSILANPVFPNGVTAIENNAYTFGEYDPVSESEKWYPAIQPVGYFAKPVTKSKDAKSYDDYDFPLTSFIDDIKPMSEE